MSRIELPSPSVRRQLRRKLLCWFRDHARSLPWRQSRNPYAIWVSEVMLQQTQVATVIRYFEHFLRSFPDIKSLAKASEQDVLRRWEGMGYYRRARDLLSAARLLARHHDGRIPDDPDILGQLPGFGRYTIGAVLSQAYGRRLPVVEANSRRVLCRLFGINGDPETSRMKTRLWDLAEAMLPRKGAGDFNQAMMELGALVCTPRQPDCPNCPLAGACRARRLGLQESIPQLRGRAKLEHQVEIAVVCRRRERVLVARRPSRGRWAGLWEFPHGPKRPDEFPDDAGQRILQELTGCKADMGDEILGFSHGITRFRIRLICLKARWLGGTFTSSFYEQGRWVRINQLAALPFSSPQRRLAMAL